MTRFKYHLWHLLESTCVVELYVYHNLSLNSTVVQSPYIAAISRYETAIWSDSKNYIENLVFRSLEILLENAVSVTVA